jgi:hypothetical protein
MPGIGDCEITVRKTYKEGNIKTGYKSIIILSGTSAHTRLSRAGGKHRGTNGFNKWFL